MSSSVHPIIQMILEVLKTMKAWQETADWPYVQKDLLASKRFERRERRPVKKVGQFTGDLKIDAT